MKLSSLSHTTTRKPRGFTMVELMVVIVILAVLASIAFTVASRAKAKARSLQCLSNVKNWSTVMVAANSELGGGRMFCPDQFMSIGPNESPFVPYWAEVVGLDGPDNRLRYRVADIWDYNNEYKGPITGAVSDNRSCPCITVGPNAYGNKGSSYTLNTYLQEPGQFAVGETPQRRYPVFRMNKIPRLSKKIYMIDCGENGDQGLKTLGKTDLVQGISEVQPSHGGRVNALFVDMHIEQLSSGDIDANWDDYVTVR